ncbi:hypothetical protein AMATHDRAFT_71049 [Amanita thiersii Skay4041]|uniref:Protein kinase domain-containing protein n=1 Tax=Amanita thiersii Skay4041 TaxID=703135 RepID=A0A2A9N821_9AGAR|nr:hypothetical protein AMATHDRAFT_71049 [Amanita thiersii Skay4041]
MLQPPTPPSRTPLRTKRNFKSLHLPGLVSPTGGGGPNPALNSSNANNAANTTTSTSTSTTDPADPIPTRLAPSGPPPGGDRRRPPPLLGDEGFGSPAHHHHHHHPHHHLHPHQHQHHHHLHPGTSASRGTNSAVLTPATGSRGTRSAIQASLTNELARLDIKGGVKFDLHNEDLRHLEELGHGNGGSVVKVEHVPSGTVMAKKIVLIDAKPAVRKQILRELQIIHECNSPYIVSSYGAFLADPNICICMEYMDKGSFDGIYKKIGAIDIDVVGQVALSVLEGLMYLYDVHRIIHRDIKPSNILCNSQGEIKLCDFGVSGELINSIAHTFVGTSVYMSPERIQGAEYSVKSDVWSLGITLIELANGRFPFSGSPDDDDDEDDDDDMPLDQRKPIDSRTTSHRGTYETTFTPTHDLTEFQEPGGAKTVVRQRRSHRKTKSVGVSLHGEGMTMSILELMHQVVNEPAPRLGSQFSKSAVEFVNACLIKNLEERKTPKALLAFEWMEGTRASGFDLKAWTSRF